jgi:molybdate transport system regulatory protein
MISAKPNRPPWLPADSESDGRLLRHRVVVDGKRVFGPGKADVLTGIRETGSLAATARDLGMSYMRAWRLVQEMHEMYAQPLVELKRGGRTRGGANLTPAGEKALLLYRRMESEALAATQAAWEEFRALLKPAVDPGMEGQ